MVWFFERGQETIRLVVTYDSATKELVATVMWSHGRENQTRFATVDAFGEWLTLFEADLDKDQWKPDGRAILLAEAWPDKPQT
jgi:hypothetical protein